jgi:hypothetical protein
VEECHKQSALSRHAVSVCHWYLSAGRCDVTFDQCCFEAAIAGHCLEGSGLAVFATLSSVMSRRSGVRVRLSRYMKTTPHPSPLIGVHSTCFRAIMKYGGSSGVYALARFIALMFPESQIEAMLSPLTCHWDLHRENS